MSKKVLKIALIVILAVIFTRAIMVMAGFGSGDTITGNRIAIYDFSGEIFSSKSTIEDLQKLEKNNNVKGIIIRVNSPGGGVAPSNEIYDYIVTIKKPVYVSMGTVAASGGYLISLGANKIYALPSTITGSIGVIMSFMNTQKLFDTIGVRSVVLKSGKYKDIGNPDRPLAEDERQVMMEIVMDMYDQFVTTIASRRNMSKDDVIKIADGRIYTGRMAQELNLVDKLGSWRDAFQDMKIMLNIPDLEIYEMPKTKKWWEEALEASSRIYGMATGQGGLYYLAEIK